MKAQQELPQASNQQTLVPMRTEGSPFSRQFDRRKKDPTKEDTVSIVTASTTAIILLPNSALKLLHEQLSAHAHADTKQWMGRVKQ